MRIKKVLVVGCGTMGAGIAQLCAQKEIEVIISDKNIDFSESAKKRIEVSLTKRIEKGKFSEDEKASVLSRISTAGDLSPAGKVDLVIESVIEDIEIKKQIFSELDKIARPDVILATNTTSLCISEMAEATCHPQRVVQMHFFNPPGIMKLVEIMPGRQTSEKTMEVVITFAEQLGKDPVVCNNEAPAGIVSRILGQLLNEATWLVESGVAEPSDIDKAMKLGAKHPMGPFELIDLIGLDIHRAKMETLRTVLADPRYQHPKYLDEMIEAGKTGRKVGKGFYDYGDN